MKINLTDKILIISSDLYVKRECTLQEFLEFLREELAKKDPEKKVKNECNV